MRFSSFIGEKMKFAIYGAGVDGKIVYEFMKNAIYCFAIDGDSQKWGKTFAGKQIVSLEIGVKELESQDCWVVVSSINYEQDMVFQLNKLRFYRYITRSEIIQYLLYRTIPENLGRRTAESVSIFFEWIAQNYKDMIQDKTSTVEFYLVDSFEISHYIPLYKELLNNGIKARIVAEHPMINTTGDWFDYEKAIDILSKESIQYCDISNPNTKIAITTQYANTLNHYRVAKRIQLSYGTALMKKAAFMFFDGVAESFDCLFVHGRIQKDILSKIGVRTEIVDFSYPRYLGVHCSKVEIFERKKIETDKPIIVYLPTWDEYSSISDLVPQFEKLKSVFYLVVKPHHCTLHLGEKKDDKELLYKCFDCILTDTDLHDAVSIADIVVCDAKSAAVSEAVFINNNIKLLMVYKNCSEDDFWYDFRTFSERITTEEDFAEHIYRIAKNDKYVNIRKKEISDFYSSDIKAGLNRAINKICSMLNNG